MDWKNSIKFCIRIDIEKIKILFFISFQRDYECVYAQYLVNG